MGDRTHARIKNLLSPTRHAHIFRGKVYIARVEVQNQNTEHWGKMSAPLMLRLLSASVTAATRAGNIIREIMSTGKLGVVDKVSNCY